jgi:hypothetical protein
MFRRRTRSATYDDAPADRPAGARAAAATATAVTGTLAIIARLIRLAAGIIFALVVVAIVLYDVKANGSNGIVKWIHNAGHFFISPFANIFNIHKPRTRLTVNWGIGAIVYLVVGAIIASILTSPARSWRRRA